MNKLKPISIIYFVLTLFFSCQKEEKAPIGGNKITIGRTTAATILYTTATVSSAVESIKGNNVIVHGHCWGTVANPVIEGNKTTLGSLTEAKTFTSQLDHLSANTSYYIRPYITTEYETIYGKETTIKTMDYAKPTVSTMVISGATPFIAMSGGNVTPDGGLPVTVRGVVWNSNGEPTITDKIGITTDANGIGSFISQLNNLQPGTTYYVRAYATNSRDTGYGEQIIFTTKSITAPEVTTANVTGISSTSATCGGNVTNDGNIDVIARGVCWKLAAEIPTINDSKTTDGTGLGSFTSHLNGLQPNADYYLRAYATNVQGTAYGPQVLFTTAQILSLATVTTLVASSVTTSNAILGGSVTDDGNSTVTERGICYGTSANPTTSNTKVTIGAGLGTFSYSVSGLTANTTYYVRAYAINSQGTVYGNEQNFKTSLAILLATVTTNFPTNITSSSAMLGGTISSDGNATVTERGVCYGTSTNPTTSNTKMTIGNGIGSFNNTVSNLTDMTTYYVRSFAINSQGTAYGNEVNFKTSVRLSLPSLTTLVPSDVKDKSAISGGNIMSDGNSAITARGVIWNTNSNLSLESYVGKTTDGIGSGNFVSELTGLKEVFKYYVRAYATNTMGTGYGNIVEFETSLPQSGIFSDNRDNRTYKWVKIGTQIWMAENLAYLPSVSFSISGSNFNEGDFNPHYYVYGYEGTNVSNAIVTSNYKTYGVLYNWAAAKTACPPGWHLPSDTEWDQLAHYIGNQKGPYSKVDDDWNTVGIHLKSSSGWTDNGNGTDDFGFNGLPSGRCLIPGFGAVNTGTYWWSSMQVWNASMIRSLSNNSSVFTREFGHVDKGFSIRCIKD